MRVLGVDPGTRRCGWGVVELSGPRLVGVAAGVIRLKSTAPLADRLEGVYDGLHALIETHKPAALAVEDMFFAKYANAAIKLGHVRGVVLLLAAKQGLGLGEYAPRLVKQTVAGRGAAEKSQVAKMVCRMLDLPDNLEEDATDALAVAITHLQAHRASNLVR